MKRLMWYLPLGALILLLTTGSVLAQATAQLSGTVRDESGAVLPGVTVTVTQTDTGVKRTAVTDAMGAYVLPNLPTGPYRLEVSLAGFRTYEQTGIVLQVSAAPVINAVLAVGSLEETVSVEAAAPLVDVRSAGISAVVENERILELPLQGRQVTDLLVLAGAAVQTGIPPRGVPGGVNISVAGGLPFGVAYTLDGATHNNPQSNTNLPLPFPDALQEFRVATSGLSAENGMHSGASVNAVTRSGTNRLVGNGFEFLRDRHFNATSPLARIGPDGKRQGDGLRRNQFGGTLGGPIVQDRLFFFGAYQVGASWGLSASYLGSYSDRLWAQTALNPGVFMGLGPCTINGVSYNVCSTNANLNQRRRFFQINPREGGLIGAMDLNSDVGFQKYRGLKLSAQRRGGSGISLNGSYTLSRCTGTATTNAFNQTFNALNRFHWGNPQTNFNSGQFGRITTFSERSAPRIMQFGVKYDF